MMMTGVTGAGAGAGDVDVVAGESGGEEAAQTPSRQYGLARLWAESADHMKSALEALCMSGQVTETYDNTNSYSTARHTVVSSSYHIFLSHPLTSLLSHPLITHLSN